MQMKMTTNDQVVSDSYINFTMSIYILLFYLCLHLVASIDALSEQLKYASLSTFMWNNLYQRYK